MNSFSKIYASSAVSTKDSFHFIAHLRQAEASNTLLRYRDDTAYFQHLRMQDSVWVHNENSGVYFGFSEDKFPAFRSFRSLCISDLVKSTVEILYNVSGGRFNSHKHGFIFAKRDRPFVVILKEFSFYAYEKWKFSQRYDPTGQICEVEEMF